MGRAKEGEGGEQCLPMGRGGEMEEDCSLGFDLVGVETREINTVRGSRAK